MGRIVTHFTNQTDSFIGGGRFTTAMVYLSEVQSGGFTIFPKLNLFFKPQSGQLLYWNLKRTDGSVDERSVDNSYKVPINQIIKNN